MRIAIAVTGLAALSLAACNDAETVADTGDPESVAAASAELPNPEPGQYRSVGELVKFEVADVPPEQVEMVRGMMGEVFAREQLQCITQEQSDEGYRGFVREMGQNDSCELTDYQTSSSSFTAKLTCSQDGANYTTDVNGDVSGTQMDMTMAMNGTFPDMGETSITLRMRSERVGDCPAGEGEGEAAG